MTLQVAPQQCLDLLITKIGKDCESYRGQVTFVTYCEFGYSPA